MNQHFDFWYAVNNTRVLRLPKNRLETFGNTVVNYHLLTELMDTANKVRVREGKVEIFKPEILTPDHMAETFLEGFGEEEAQNYMQWLQDHQKDLYILKYGFMLRKFEANEHVISEHLDVVADRIMSDLNGKDDPLGALVVGVDDPWEVCLIQLMVEMVKKSAPEHIRGLKKDPTGIRREIEEEFRRATGDRRRIQVLSAMLQDHDLFAEYEDRFFQLVRSS